MSIIITAKVLVFILLFFVISYTSFAIGAYCDIRFLKSNPSDYDDVPIALPPILGILFALMITFTIIQNKIKAKSSNFIKIAELAKKHREQDEDVTYQLEKVVFDEK